ncbi:BQ2448_2563 [Microbotryum intermedium]|uniref:BQ2448_2563 protein n=1 Tax=Microbotryum intermedium TaxID=269621 RepID=A0A238FC15_9BASI|nr:BQ2448_2563 [Microbotryum intermedium]
MATLPLMFSPLLSQTFDSTLSLHSPRPTALDMNDDYDDSDAEHGRLGGGGGGGGGGTMAPLSPFEQLPPELIEAIAFAVCRQSPIGVPSSLLSVFLISKRFYDVLGPRNEGFYADLFRQRFDWRSVERRWATVNTLSNYAPVADVSESKLTLLVLCYQMKAIEDKREKKWVLLESATEARPANNLKFTVGSFTRPNSPSEYLLKPTSVWRPLMSRDLAPELKRRCTILTRMRSAALAGSIPPSSSRPSSPRMQAMVSPNGPVLTEPDELTQNLWTCYLMLLENELCVSDQSDGKNLAHLVGYGLMRTYMRLFYEHSLFTEALNPGWPRQTAGRALGLWIGWLGGDDLSAETPTESEQRFFVLKPYVFGAHKFDAFHVPWTIPSLPVTRQSHPIVPPPTGAFLADLRPRTHAQIITHMGRRIEMTPPVLAHAAIFSFFYRVEQDPSQISADVVNAAVAGAPPRFHLQTNTNGAAVTATVGGAGAISSRPVKTELPTLVSKLHDRDFARLALCIDPYSSRGLPTLCTRGDLAGSWEGRFSFFDFDSYREMLGGRMRSLYEGPFGDQPQVWKIEETIVKLEPGQRQGGKGPVLNAGYEIGQFGPLRRSQSLDRGPSASTWITANSGEGAMLSRRVSEDMARGSRTESSSTRVSKRPRDIVEEPIEWEEDREGEDEDGEYEILLSGSGHSAWGQFNLKGRVRSYDGMFSITKEYTPDSRGRWLYRGYCVSGNLVGRWRDTHTPIDMSGYEGQYIPARRTFLVGCFVLLKSNEYCSN